MDLFPPEKEAAMKGASLILVATMASLTSVPVSAQNRGYDTPPSQNVPPDRMQCRINKLTKKRECHTYQEWRKIAAALDAQQPGQTPPPSPPRPDRESGAQ
jgi:hypothetical protein